MISESRNNPLFRFLLFKIPRIKVLPALRVLISGASAGFFSDSPKKSCPSKRGYSEKGL
jgi:hypothetical protein